MEAILAGTQLYPQNDWLAAYFPHTMTYAPSPHFLSQGFHGDNHRKFLFSALQVHVALDDQTADPDNGCLRFIPGSHRSGSFNEQKLSNFQKNFISL